MANFDKLWPGSSGDHIDLWDGTRIAHGSNTYFELSRELWFWPMA